MSSYEWIRYSGQEWFTSNPETQLSSTVHESEKPHPVVIFDHDGNALMRKPFQIGFQVAAKK